MCLNGQHGLIIRFIQNNPLNSDYLLDYRSSGEAVRLGGDTPSDAPRASEIGGEAEYGGDRAGELGGDRDRSEVISCKTADAAGKQRGGTPADS